MSITRFHMNVAVLIALALHGGVAMWIRQAGAAPRPESSPPPLRVSLLAPVAEATVTTSQPVSEPPLPESVSKPAPAPPPRPRLVPKPKPAPVPVTQNTAPELPAKSRQVQTQNRPAPPPAEIAAAPLNAEAAAEYEQLLVAWLEKHKKYPRRARRLRIEGEGRLRIVIDRAGRARQIELQQRTGNRLLDKAALEMARRADPFPPMPENDPREGLEFIVPVAFVLR